MGECLLNKNRNPGSNDKRDKSKIEAYLKEYLGAKKVIWLPLGCLNDEDTNGHVDNLCCFTSPGHVTILSEEDDDEPQYEVTEEAIEILESHGLTVHRVQQPPALCYTKEESDGLHTAKSGNPVMQLIYWLFGSKDAVERLEGTRMAGSYLNFLIVNGGVIVPGFGGDAKHTDRMAVKTLKRLFPNRKVVQVMTRDVLLGGGNIHCITQQEPKKF